MDKTELSKVELMASSHLGAVGLLDGLPPGDQSLKLLTCPFHQETIQWGWSTAKSVAC